MTKDYKQVNEVIKIYNFRENAGGRGVRGQERSLQSVQRQADLRHLDPTREDVKKNIIARLGGKLSFQMKIIERSKIKIIFI